MNLIIDVGNTRIKLAIFNGEKLEELKISSQDAFDDDVEALSRAYSIHCCILSSTGKIDQKQQRLLQLRFPTTILSHRTSLPIVLDYKTPETLGMDRVGVVSAFAKAYPATAGLVIDAGSCITYDVVTADAVYKGGVIAPGLQMRYRAMHNQTAGLPKLEALWPETSIGVDTHSSMHHGVLTAMCLEIDGFIERFKALYGVEKVIITGGDAHYLAKRLKNSIFAHSNFLLEGLNYILKYQND